MDEIDWIKNTKKALILLTKIFIGVAIFFTILGVIGMVFRNDWSNTEESLAYLLVVFLMIIAPIIILIICYSIMFIIGKVINSGRKVINFDTNYMRDIPRFCSPAIASLIYDLKIDVYKDYTATILYLCTHKYINFKKYGNNYRFILGEQTDYSKLDKSEKYVLNIIINKSEFDNNKFKEEIIKEAKEKQLITNKKYRKEIKIILILLLAIILLTVVYNINKMIWMFLFSIFGGIVIGYIYFFRFGYTELGINNKDTECIRTKKGKELAIILEGLKKYVKDYTLIREREIEYVNILEDYIPYAISLDEADKIEEFIKYNEEYRDLIYNRKKA